MTFVGNAHAILFLFFSQAWASLYPIKPIANTIYDAGHSALVEWIDTHTLPHLEDITINKIDLYLGDNIFVATVARDVDPLRKSQSIDVPWDAKQSEKYTLRFFCHEQPPSIVYTAYFKIRNSGESTDNMPSNDSSPLDVFDHVPTRTFNESDSVTSWYQPVLTVVLPNVTYTSTLAPTMQIVPSAYDSYKSPTHSLYGGARGAMALQLKSLLVLWLAVFVSVVAL